MDELERLRGANPVDAPDVEDLVAMDRTSFIDALRAGDDGRRTTFQSLGGVGKRRPSTKTKGATAVGAAVLALVAIALSRGRRGRR